MGAYIDREQALSHPFANDKYDHINANKDFIRGFESYKEWLENLPTIDLVRCGECIYFDYDGISDYGRCSKKDVYEWNYKPTDFCSSGDRRADYTVFTVNPPKGVETSLKGDVTVFHKNSKMGESVARPTATSSTEVPWWIGE